MPPNQPAEAPKVASEGTQEFYAEVIGRLLRGGVLTTDSELLVVCGGLTDRNVLRDYGFARVVISNVDQGAQAAELAPYEWRYQDAERLSFPDESFDFCVVHSGLHHCYSPHRALLEMYRVARRGLLLFEPYDNVTTRLGVRFKVGQEYEHAAVYYNGYAHGGAGNGPVPNFIYRWTEQEIRKVIHSYAPHARHKIEFMYRMRIPWGQVRARRSRALRLAVRASVPALKALEWCLPKQSNNFAALVHKPQLPAALHPWLRLEAGSIRLDEQWLAARYGGGVSASR